MIEKARPVKQEKIGQYGISTVQLPENLVELGRSWGKEEIPEGPVFETRVFKCDAFNSIYLMKCGSEEEALIEHQKAVEWVNQRIRAEV